MSNNNMSGEESFWSRFHLYVLIAVVCGFIGAGTCNYVDEQELTKRCPTILETACKADPGNITCNVAVRRCGQASTPQ